MQASVPPRGRGSTFKARHPLSQGKTLLALLSIFTLLWMLIPSTGTPAHAAGGNLNLSVEAVNATVKSGEGASFRVQWSCSGAGSCDNGRIEVPVPGGTPGSDAFPDGIPLAITSQSDISGGAATIEGEAPDQVLVWTLPATVNTGDSGTVSFTLTPPNSVTPDGTVIAPTATFTADGATTVVANEDGSEQTVVEAKVSLNTHKTKAEPTDVPYVNQQVTYQIMVGYDEQFPAAGGPNQYVTRMSDICSTLGVQALENLVLVDTLEPGVQFVEATMGGVYDEATNTVTWDFGSSIYDDAPYDCKSANGVFGWSAPRVTVIYPDAEFSANPATDAVTNSAVATANPWGQPDIALNSETETSHALREGSAGATVAKSPGYDWAVGSPIYRDVRSSNYLYYLTGSTLDSQPANWEVVDVMPCGLTSPMDANDTDCGLPAYTDLNFSADGTYDELEVEWTTNAGSTGVCVIPAGTGNTKRFCDGTTGGTDAAPGVPAGEWITKIEVDTMIPAYGGGHIYIYGTPNGDLPLENVDTVYNNPDLDVDRSDVHPWFVTVENCTVTNTITFQSGQVWTPPTPQTAGDNGGICGYRQVMSDPLRLNPAKSMYDPDISPRPSVPAIQPGGELTVDLNFSRDTAGQSEADNIVPKSTFTPTVTEYLPANLVFDEESLQILAQSSGYQVFVDALGEPQVDIETVTFDGEERQKITITFPEANIPPGTVSMNKGAIARFQVQVKDGVPAGTYTNDYLLTAAEGGPDINDTYLICVSGTLVDADLNPIDKTDQSSAVGCLVEARYTVLPVPGAKVEKTVQGAYDGAPVDAPGIGSTDVNGDGQYVVNVLNSGSVDIRNVVAYDMLPRVGDTMTLPGNTDARNSEFPVYLTDPVAEPTGATVQYSSSDNPCRGDLAGTGGGAISSAPSGCENDWTTTAPTDLAQVTAIRIDFGDRVFAAGESEQIELNVQAPGEGKLDGVAWNNAAIVAVEASSGRSTLPIEQTPVGLQLSPSLSWAKTDGATDELLAGSSWTLNAVDGEVSGFPLTIEDCAAESCNGPDIDPVAGQFTLAGIPWGEYELTEVTAPDGYELLEDPISVTLNEDTVDGDLMLALGEIDNRTIQGDWTLAKTSDPASGSVVAPGDTVTYTLTAVNDSDYPVTGVSVTDDLSDVLNNAAFDQFVNDDGGLAIIDGNTITWSVGELAANETRTVSYAVTIDEDAKGVTIRNVVSGDGDEPPADCTPEEPCDTTHETPAEWSLSKTSDPESGSEVQPGDTVTYTLTAVNASEAAVADVLVTDDLSDVLNNAEFSEFVNDDGGLATIDGNTVTWNVGELAAGETREVSYAVTLNEDAKGVTIRNVVSGEGEVPPTDCTPIEPCDTTHETPPEWTVAKTSDPESGSQVQPGDTVTYTLTAENTSQAPVTDAVVTDDLSDVLNNAEFGEFIEDDAGNAVIDGNTITWNVGELAADETRTVSYTVTVNEDAKGVTIRNVVTGTGEVPPTDCTPEEPCDTTHETPPEWTLAKTSDPESGSVVAPGDAVTYTLTAQNTSKADVSDVLVTDDLSDVLNNAEFGEFVNDDDGLATIDGNTITWNVGTLAAGETRTVTYSVTIDETAKGVTIRNVVTGNGEEPPTDCTPEEPCDTTHETPAEWSLSKTSDPETGSQVQPGDAVTYTLTAVNASEAAVTDVVVTDDLSDVLNNARFEEFVNDDGGLAARDGNTITWNVGELAAGETRTVSYTVTVNEDAYGVTIQNFVTGEGSVPPEHCTPEEPCDTTHGTPEPPAETSAGNGLAMTGSAGLGFIGGGALLLLLLGATLVYRSRRTHENS